MIRVAIHSRAVIFTSALSFIIITVALLATGHIKFSFFPSYTSDRITIEVDFDAKATFDQKREYLATLENYTVQTISNIDGTVLKNAYVVMNKRLGERYSPNPINNGIQVWLTAQDKRETSNETLISALNSAPPESSLVRQIIIDQPRGGPPSDTLQIELIGNDEQLTLAVNDLKAALSDFSGVTNIQDDISTLIPNHYFSLDSTMLFTGINHQSLYNQVQSYLQDSKNFTLSKGGEEVEVIIKLPEEALKLKDQLITLPIILPNDSYLPLGEVADFSVSEKPQQLIRKNRNRTATVSARVDSSITNTYEIESIVQNEIIPKLEDKYAIITMAGKIKQDQLKTISELKSGALIGICAIFLIRPWYTWLRYYTTFIIWLLWINGGYC
jgi:multidrug efflux pump subunit AcrB